MNNWIKKTAYIETTAFLYSIVLGVYSKFLLRHYPSQHFSIEEALDLLSRSGVWIVFLFAMGFCGLLVYNIVALFRYYLDEDSIALVLLLSFIDIILIVMIIILLSNPILRAIATIFGIGAGTIALIE